MKKLLLIAAALLCATVLTVQAADKKAKKELTPEQKQVQTDMLAKYDTNKDGKLDATEKAAMTPDDKAKYDAAFPPHKKKKDAAAPAN
ncbi:MAG: hypothetical protein WCH99_13005 [Verrucomicrobiota bacterium]